MPWPDFSELSFGFSFLRELDFSLGPTPFPVNFISQQLEADLGFDVAVFDVPTSPMLIQLKRSFVVKSTQSKEAGLQWGKPIYRMYLRKNRGYDQHRKLRKAETAGYRAFYVTSRVRDTNELYIKAGSRSLISDGSKSFLPSSIPLPTDTKQHWVSFNHDGTRIQRFSKEPLPVADEIPSLAEFLAEATSNPMQGESLHRYLLKLEADIKAWDPKAAYLAERAMNEAPAVARIESGADDQRLQQGLQLAKVRLMARISLDASLILALGPASPAKPQAI